MAYEKLAEELLGPDVPDAVQEVITAAFQNDTRTMNLTRVLSQFHFTTNLQEAARNVIDANSELAKSNDTHSRTMFWLTFVIAGSAVLQAVVTFVK